MSFAKFFSEVMTWDTIGKIWAILLGIEVSVRIFNKMFPKEK